MGFSENTYENNIFMRLVGVLRSACSISDSIEITENTSLVDDLSLDSLDIIDLISAIESEFEIDFELPEEDEENNFNNLTVGKIAEYILEIISENENNFNDLTVGKTENRILEVKSKEEKTERFNGLDIGS